MEAQQEPTSDRPSDAFGNRVRALSVDLCTSYLILTALVIAVVMAAPAFSKLPGLKVIPFLMAGLWAGRRGPAPPKAKIAASVVLAIFASIAWSTYTWLNTGIEASKFLTLIFASIVVMLAGSVWAYVGMFLTGRRAEARNAARERMRQ